MARTLIIIIIIIKISYIKKYMNNKSLNPRKRKKIINNKREKDSQMVNGHIASTEINHQRTIA